MATFPTYNSNNNITTTLGPTRNQAAQPFEDNAKVIGTIQKTTQSFSDAHDVMQETKAKTSAEMAFANQEELAKNDPNPDNAEMHIKAIQDAASNSVKGIDNQELVGKVQSDVQQSAFLSGIKIQDMFKKKQIFANDQRLDALATTTAKTVSEAVTPAQAQQDEDNFMQTLRDNTNMGLISPERGLMLARQFKLGVVKNKITNNPSTDEADYKGLTDGLDLNEATQAEKMISAHIKQNQQIEIQSTLKNRVDTVKGIANGTYTWQNADQISKIATRDPKLGEALQAVFNADAKGGQYKPVSDQDQNFAELVNKLFSTKTKEEVSDYLVKALNSSSEKNMSRDRLAILVNAAEQRGASLDTNKESGDGKDDPQQKAVEASVKHIQEYVKDQPKEKNPFSAVVDFFKGLSGGGNPQQAKDDAIKSYNVQAYPWIGNLPKEGAVYRDKATGSKRRIFPDGTFKEEK